jgi:hypothetical protein
MYLQIEKLMCTEPCPIIRTEKMPNTALGTLCPTRNVLFVAKIRPGPREAVPWLPPHFSTYFGQNRGDCYWDSAFK